MAADRGKNNYELHMYDTFQTVHSFNRDTIVQNHHPGPMSMYSWVHCYIIIHISQVGDIGKEKVCSCKRRKGADGMLTHILKMCP